MSARRPLSYIDMMGGQKPHLLIKSINNLGAETVVEYVSSTKFYLADKRAGNPGLQSFPFPFMWWNRSRRIDRISRNRMVARYAYHHGYFAALSASFAVSAWWSSETQKSSPAWRRARTFQPG